MKAPSRMIQGYRKILVEGHSRADRDGYVLEHVAVAEAALGRALPSGVVVHHVNETKDDNSGINLVICEDRKYHKLLHVRLKIVQRGGDPNTEKICSRCQAVLSQGLFFSTKSNYDGLTHNCKACYKEQGRGIHLRLKAAAASYREGKCRCSGCAELYRRYQARCGLFAQRRRRAAALTGEVSG